MLTDFYDYTVFISSVLLLFFGMEMALNYIPSDRKYADYRFTKRVLGVCFVVWSVECFVLWFFNIRRAFQPMASAINITMYYYAAVSFYFGFIRLLNPQLITKRLVVGKIMPGLAMAVLAWGSLPFFKLGYGLVAYVLLCLAAFAFVYHVVLMIYQFIKEYKNTVKHIDDYYYDNVGIFVSWMYKSVLFVIILGSVSGFVSFAPQWVVAVHAACAIPMYVYIYSSMQSYLVHYIEVNNAMMERTGAEPEPVLAQDSNAAMANEAANENAESEPEGKTIADQIEQWVSDKEYLSNGIRLTDVAAQFGTNRTYLSQYINQTYHCNFRKWINQLRVCYAMELMTQAPSISLDQLSATTGYLSTSHFVKTFSELIGESPSEWRNRNFKSAASAAESHDHNNT